MSNWIGKEWAAQIKKTHRPTGVFKDSWIYWKLSEIKIENV